MLNMHIEVRYSPPPVAQKIAPHNSALTDISGKLCCVACQFTSLGAVYWVWWHSRQLGIKGTLSVSVSKLSLFLKPQFAAGSPLFKTMTMI